jgi:hypothetical protein
MQRVRYPQFSVENAASNNNLTISKGELFWYVRAWCDSLLFAHKGEGLFDELRPHCENTASLNNPN